MFYRYMVPNWMVRLNKFLETIHLYSRLLLTLHNGYLSLLHIATATTYSESNYFVHKN